MTQPTDIRFQPADTEGLADFEGVIAVILGAGREWNDMAATLDGLTHGTLSRLRDSDSTEDMKPGDVKALGYPAGIAAKGVLVIRLDAQPAQADARRAGAELAKAQGGAEMLVLAGGQKGVADIALGLALRGYTFDRHRAKGDSPRGRVTFRVDDPDAAAREARHGAAIAEGVFFTRDLTNEPANILTTDDFAARLAAMQEIGLDVEILEEDRLAELGMGALLCVGQGSDSPSKVVVMRWNGGGDAAPLVLVGKGVVFDTGGISLKKAPGMEDMTMDMGGAGVVAGVMRTLALRRAKANVVGLVGLVENMPSGRAVRPGDVVRSMKGDTIEVINTDAEGRLVLADVLWYAQERFKPARIVDLATLTGAIITALGHEHAGVFSNDDALANALTDAAGAEGEGAWRLPLGEAYDKLLKSRVADMKNVGGPAAGSITAAQFLQRFIVDGTPWVHLDIAGVASVKTETALAPKGATGWGVMTLNRLIADRYERR